jgi:hypothetical protein
MCGVRSIKNTVRASPHNRVLSITFWTTVTKAKRFSVPQGAARLLQLRFEDEVAIDVWSTFGERLYRGKKKLKSETEMYGTDIKRSLRSLEPGTSILVVASRP